jgi:catechol 2,3-dioxygenase-like lactoylglutathione lyase family enzyme
VVPALKLNHVGLRASSVDVARDFFENHFGRDPTYERAGELASSKTAHGTNAER